MLLRDGLGADDETTRIETAVDAALESGVRTADLAGGGEAEGVVGTADVTQAVLKAI
jgi:isocitrate dehydrogenase